MLRHLFRSLIALTLSAGPLMAQGAAGEAGALRVYLDCDECDFDYIRTETPWVSFVRERLEADVHIIVTQISTGAGGREFTINLVGRERFATRSDTLRFVSEPNQAQEVMRSGLTRTIQLALTPYVLQTPQASRLRVSFDEPDEDRQRGTPETDRWNAWVFRVGADGQLDREQTQSDLQVDGSFSARRTTDNWKMGVSANAEFSRDRFEVEEDDVIRKVTRQRENYSGGGIIIKSLGPHWGTGLQATVSSSTFQNTKLAVRAAPAIEYSLWPYSEATRRQLTFQYSVGVSSFDYREETIFSKFSETRPTQSFLVGYDMQQEWGQADASLETAGFLDDFEQYQLVFDFGLELQLFRGLSLDIGASASLIRDQLSIVKRDPDPEEVLLDLRELLTDYRYDFSFGFSYTFGSIFNTVVNPRFGSGPGQILP